MIKRFQIICFLYAALAVSGCGGTELENKSFPLAVLVSEKEGKFGVCYLAQQLSEVSNERADGENVTAAAAAGSSYYESHKTFEKNNRCQLDMSHTKAIIFQKDFIGSEPFISFLETVRNENMYARNTLVYITDSNMGKLEKLNNTLEVPLGSYLEQMMKNEQDMEQQAAVTIGLLLNEQANSSRTLLIPVLREENGQPVITEYEALQDFEPKGRISMEQAQIHYLIEGQLGQMHLELEDGVEVQLSDLKCKRDFILSGSSVTQRLEVSAETEQVAGEAGQADIADLLQKNIENACRGAKEENGIDLSDSSRYLPLYSPQIYKMYEGQEAEYRRNLDYQAKVRVVEH